jgi:hypothetical protein
MNLMPLGLGDVIFFIVARIRVKDDPGRISLRYMYICSLVPGRSAESCEELRSESWQDDRLLRLKYDQLNDLPKLYLQSVSEI